MQEHIGSVRFEQVTTLTIGCKGLDASSHSRAVRTGDMVRVELTTMLTVSH